MTHHYYDEIAKVAHELYEKSGRAPGRDLENWLEAERIVMARHGGDGHKQKAGRLTEAASEEQPAKKKVTAAKKTPAKKAPKTR